MSLSIRDQLQNIGLLKPGPNTPSKSGQSGAQTKPTHHAGAKRPAAKSNQTQIKSPDTGLSLAQAWQAREQQEKQLALEKKRLADEKAQQKRARKAAVIALLQHATLNAPDAELARYFQYANKIRKVYVTAAQREQVNRGEIAIVQMDGRFLLVNAEVAEKIKQAGPEFLALFGASDEPDAPVDESYGDAKYQVPDDLVW